jgi:predicted DNA-binding protein
MKKNLKKQTGIRLPDELKAAGMARALYLQRSFGSYIRSLIAEDLEKSNQPTLSVAEDPPLPGGKSDAPEQTAPIKTRYSAPKQPNRTKRQ